VKKKVYVLFYTLFCIIAVALALFPIIINLMGSFWNEAFVENIFSSTVEEAVSQKNEYESIFSLSQYVDVLIASPDYLYRFWNSVFLAAPVVLFQIAVSSLTAYGLARGKGRFFQATLLLFLVLMMLPKQVTVIPNYYAVKELKLTNTWAAVWLPGIFSPFCVYLLTRYMKRIPEELFEAARIDGAGERRAFFYVALPICKGEIIALGTLVLVDAWNQVEIPLIMFNKATMYPLSVYLSKIREDAVGITFAASIIYMIPVILLFFYGSKGLEEDMTKTPVDAL
jgi:multiple sugar transport system permease protein